MNQKNSVKQRHPEASMHDRPQRSLKLSSPSVTIPVLLFLGVMIYLGIQLSHLVYFNERREAFFYDQHTPIMTTPDAYYYLRLTSDLIKGQYNTVDELCLGHERPRPIPLMVSVSALIHQVSGISIERIAFYLPPVLASLMVIVYLLWGYALGGPVVTLVALLAGVSSSYWCIRTCLGYFDTDCLNPVFFYLIIFCVYRFASIQSRRRFLYLVVSLFLSFLFRLWWIPGGHLGLLVIALTYSTSFFMVSSKGERLVKICLLAMLSLVGLAVISDSLEVLPGFLSRYLGPEVEYLQLIQLVKEPTSFLPNVGQSISELHSLSLRDVAVKVSGNEIPLVLSVVGLFFLFKRKKEVANFFLPGLLFGLGSLFSQRFIIFFVPVYAIGIGYLSGEILLKCKYLQAIHSPFLRLGLWSLIVILLLFPSFSLSFSGHPRPSQTPDDVRLARAIANASSPQSVIWAWWDSGYFLQYIAGRKTIIDGGSQSPERTFITAYPMACENVVLSRNWIRFFAAHDPGDLGILVSHLGDLPRALSFLQEALANPDDLDSILGKHELNDPPFWRHYLFPEVEAYLYLDYENLTKSVWWYEFGTWDFERQRGKRPDLFKVLHGNILVSEQNGVVIDGDYFFKVDRVISVGSSGGDVNQVQYRDFRGRDRNDRNMRAALDQNKKVVSLPESVMVVNKSKQTAYVLDGELFQSLFYKLLLQHPYDTNQFSPLAYFASEGGAWRVE